MLGTADFWTLITGLTSMMVTVASSVAVTTLPSLSSPVAVTVSVSLSPASPLTVATNEQA